MASCVCRAFAPESHRHCKNHLWYVQIGKASFAPYALQDMHAARQTNSNASQQAGHYVGCMAKFGRKSTDCPVRDEHGRDLPQHRSMRWIERLAQHQVCDFLSDLRRACSELGSNVCALKLHVSKKTSPVDRLWDQVSPKFYPEIPGQTAFKYPANQPGRPILRPTSRQAVSSEHRPRNFRPDRLPSSTQ